MPSTSTLYETVSCNLCDGATHHVVREAVPRHSRDFVSEFRSSADGPLTEQVVVCAECGLQFVSPRLHSHVILEGYREGSDERFVSQATARERTFAWSLRHIERHAGAGHLLDIGTAAGSFMHVAETRGWKVSGCEPNRWMCEWGRLHYGLHIAAGTLSEQQYPDQTFDVVTLWDVLEHDGDPRRLLAECYRVLRPGGMVVVNYPDVGSWIAKVMGRRWVMYLTGHLYFFTRRTISDLLQRTGFQVVEIRPHLQWLELQYVLLRAGAVGVPRFVSTVAKQIGIGGWHVPYWIGQTFVIARK